MVAQHAAIDWARCEEKYRGLKREELLGALTSIHAVLDSADEMDRADGGNRGGYYRDECSVIRKELRVRDWLDEAEDRKASDIADMAGQLAKAEGDAQFLLNRCAILGKVVALMYHDPKISAWLQENELAVWKQLCAAVGKEAE